MISRIKSVFAVVIVAWSNVAITAEAVRLVINPCGPVVVQNCLEAPHFLGQPFPFWVVAVDSAGAVASSYSGTVGILSADPQAILPSAHTFTAADGSSFMFTITLNSPGQNVSGDISKQTVTAIDQSSDFTASHAFFVRGAGNNLATAAVAVPLSPFVQIVAAVLLILAALARLVRKRERNS